MAYWHILILLLIFLANLSSAALCATTPSHASPVPPPPAHTQPPAESKQIISKSPPTEPPVSYNDFTNFNLSTPEKATISFVKLYNGILPASPATDLEEICAKSATPDYNKSCLKILENRLSYLKGVVRNLKGYMFKCQPPTILNKSPMKLEASWREKLFFFDGRTQLREKKLIITLLKSDSKWLITNTEQE